MFLRNQEEIFFRELNEECPYPEAVPPMKPTEKECFYYAKKSVEVVEGAIEAIGISNAEIISRCYLQCIGTEIT